MWRELQVVGSNRGVGDGGFFLLLVAKGPG